MSNEPGLRSDVGDETICDMIARQVTGQPWREYDFLEIVGGDVNAADGGGNYDGYNAQTGARLTINQTTARKLAKSTLNKQTKQNRNHELDTDGDWAQYSKKVQSTV